MIEKVILENFKRFDKQEFDLNAVLLAGPNNTGKTTLMQAIATWNFALNRWIEKENLSSSQKTQPVEKENFSSKNKTGVRITRESFLSMPLRSLNYEKTKHWQALAWWLLWKDNSTSLKKKEGKLGSPRFMYITLKGNNNNNKWELKLRFYYANPEVVYAKPLSKIPPELPENNIVYIPSFSGIAVQEPIHAEAYQQWLIGQGKPGDIIRNLLLEISKDDTKWKKLNAEIKNIFGYELLKPQSSGQPFILCDFRKNLKSCNLILNELFVGLINLILQNNSKCASGSSIRNKVAGLAWTKESRSRVCKKPLPALAISNLGSPP